MPSKATSIKSFYVCFFSIMPLLMFSNLKACKYSVKLKNKQTFNYTNVIIFSKHLCIH